jgi:hypothetical protein
MSCALCYRALGDAAVRGNHTRLAFCDAHCGKAYSAHLIGQSRDELVRSEHLPPHLFVPRVVAAVVHAHMHRANTRLVGLPLSSGKLATMIDEEPIMKQYAQLIGPKRTTTVRALGEHEEKDVEQQHKTQAVMPSEIVVPELSLVQALSALPPVLKYSTLKHTVDRFGGDVPKMEWLHAQVSGPVGITHMKSEELELEVAIFGEYHERKDKLGWFCPRSFYAIEMRLLLEKIFRHTTRQIEFYFEEYPHADLKTYAKTLSPSLLYMDDVHRHFFPCFHRGFTNEPCEYPLVRFHAVDIRLFLAQGMYFPYRFDTAENTHRILRTGFGTLAVYIAYIRSARYDEGNVSRVAKQRTKVHADVNSYSRISAAKQITAEFDKIHKFIGDKLLELEYNRIIQTHYRKLDVLDLNKLNSIVVHVGNSAAFLMDEYTLMRMLKPYTRGSRVITYVGNAHSATQIYMLRKVGVTVVESLGLGKVFVSFELNDLVESWYSYRLSFDVDADPACLTLTQPEYGGAPPFYAPFFPVNVNRDMALIAWLLQYVTVWAIYEPHTTTMKRSSEELSLIELFNASSAEELVSFVKPPGYRKLEAFVRRVDDHVLLAFPKTGLVCLYLNFISRKLSLLSGMPSVQQQWFVLENGSEDTLKVERNYAFAMIDYVIREHRWAEIYYFTAPQPLSVL